jgi:hypothetical protein
MCNHVSHFGGVFLFCALFLVDQHVSQLANGQKGANAQCVNVEDKHKDKDHEHCEQWDGIECGDV